MIKKLSLIPIISILLLTSCEEDTKSDTGAPCRVMIEGPSNVVYSTVYSAFDEKKQNENYLIARVIGSGCDANKITWSIDSIAPFEIQEEWYLYNNRYTSWSSINMSAVSIPRVWGTKGSTGRVSARYPGGTADTIEMVVSDKRLGEDILDSNVFIYNDSRDSYDNYPLWYFFEMIIYNKKLGDNSLESERWNLPRSIDDPNFSQGLDLIEQDYYFDPYLYLQKTRYSQTMFPKRDPEIIGRNNDKVTIGSVGGGISTANASSLPQDPSCSSLSCVRPGDIYLGDHASRHPIYWYKNDFPYYRYVHAAMKSTYDTRYVEAVSHERGIRISRTFADLKTYFGRQGAILRVSSSSSNQGRAAAEWAQQYAVLGSEASSRYPYKISPWLALNKGTEAKYKSFYCSQLVWAAWYHTTYDKTFPQNTVDLRATKATFITPGQLPASRKLSKIIVY